MTKLTATRGLPGSGKTTWAKTMLDAAEPGALARVNRDSLRRMLHGRGHGRYATENQVTMVQHRAVEDFLRAGVDVVVDDTNLKASVLRKLAEIAWKCGAEFDVQDFTDITVDECLDRNAHRDGFGRVPSAVILGMHSKYLAGRELPLPVPVRPATATSDRYVPDSSKPRAVMVDIDGTVALHGDRDPYDTSRYHEDQPNQSVITAIQAMWQMGHFVIFCSGRDEEFREVTEDWIRAVVGVWPPRLFMRPKGDRRRDDVVKLELFDKHIRHEWNVVAVFDDRQRVVDAWRSIGLTVFQVAPGDF